MYQTTVPITWSQYYEYQIYRINSKSMCQSTQCLFTELVLLEIKLWTSSSSTNSAHYWVTKGIKCSFSSISKMVYLQRPKNKFNSINVVVNCYFE